VETRQKGPKRNRNKTLIVTHMRAVNDCLMPRTVRGCDVSLKIFKLNALLRFSWFYPNKRDPG